MNKLLQKFMAKLGFMVVPMLFLFFQSSLAQDGITNTFAFGGGLTNVDEMRYASDGNLYFVARLGGKNQFAGNNYDGGASGSFPLQQWLFGKVSSSGQQTVLKVLDRVGNLYNSLGSDYVIDKDGNLICLLESTFPGNDYGDGLVETAYGAKIAKVSNGGVVQWVKPVNTGVNVPYGSSGLAIAGCNALQVMDDGSIYTVVAANHPITDSANPNLNKYPIRVIKFNNSGDEVWHHELAINTSSSWNVTPPKQFVDNNGNLMLSMSGNSATFISEGTTMTATNVYGGYYFCFLGLNSMGARTWFHSTALGANFRAVDANNGIAYVAYSYTNSSGAAPSISPYSTLPNLNPIFGTLGNTTYLWGGMLKLDVATGNINNTTANLPAPSNLMFLTAAEKLHVRNDGSLIFYSYRNSSQIAGSYVIGDNYNALVFCDANYGNVKVSQGSIPKVELIAENSTNFAMADGFSTALTLGGNAITPFLVDTDFGTRFPSWSAAKTDAYIAQGVISQIGAPKVTRWTGAVSTVWNNAGNWTNGVPDAITTAEFDTTVPNQPSVSSSTTVGNFTIGSGTVVTMPSTNITIKNKLTVNGTLKFPVAGFSFFDGYTAPFIDGNGTIEFTGTGTGYISISNLSQLAVKTAVALSFTGSVKSLEFVGASAKITGNVNVTSPDPNAISGASTTNFIDGKLTRAVNSNGNYSFPVGKGSTYTPAAITLNNATGISSIAAAFSTTTVSGGPSNLSVTGATIVKALAGGSWTITPDVALTGGAYNITLSAAKGSSTATNFALLKRPEGSTSATAWVLPSTDQSFSINGSTVTVTANNVNSFSQYIIGEKINTLPVTLAKFNAKAVGSITQLNWETASEKNSSHFLLERSSDGLSFSIIAELKAKGNSDVLSGYFFRDLKPNNGTNYYRLKMVDLDHTFTYSEPIAVKFDLNETKISIFPNPVAKTLYLSGINDKEVVASLYDSTGQKIAAISIVNNTLELPNNVPNGIYILSLQLKNGQTHQQQIIISK